MSSDILRSAHRSRAHRTGDHHRPYAVPVARIEVELLLKLLGR